jgi:hypothetical protein
MASSGQISTSNGGRVISVEERRALVQRVVSSHAFEKSRRMRDLLAYVCSRALDEGAVDIREHEIGCAVFGRPDDYDTGEDNIVRVNASQVRKKLEAYFAAEGTAEPVILELPKGRYVPAFRERPELEVSSPAAIAEPQAFVALPVPALAPSRLVYAVAALSPLLMIACIWMGSTLWRGRAQAAAQDSSVNALWSQLIRKGESTDIVLTDSSLGLLQDLLGRAIGLSEYLQPETWRVDSLAGRPELQAVARLAAHRHYTSLANVNITRRIQAVAGADQGQLTAVFARDFNVRQMKSDNVVLIGSRRANPWVELVEGQLNFRFGYDAAASQSFFENRQPRGGELAVYRNSPAVSYCDLALLPNLSHTGNLLVISGTEMEGTEAGGEFLTTPRGMATLQRHVKPDSSGRFPYFEALLKSSKIGGAAPGFEVIAVRVLARTP